MIGEARKLTCKRYRERHPEKVRAASRKWNQTESGKRIRGDWEKARGREYRRDYYARKRIEAIQILGGRCACCGESEYAFLAIDHPNGGGHKERRAGVVCHGLLKRVRESPHLYRVLCHNCNMAVAFHGACPHGGLETIAKESAA